MVETGGLENRLALTGYGGSNPSPSATSTRSRFEIKWRDATTDGDHITKEHSRMKAIQGSGLQPIRVMFYYPNRTQAIPIQETLKTLYDAVGGLYFAGDDSWKFIQAETGIDLLAILRKIARERMQN